MHIVVILEFWKKMFNLRIWLQNFSTAHWNNSVFFADCDLTFSVQVKQSPLSSDDDVTTAYLCHIMYEAHVNSWNCFQLLQVSVKDDDASAATATPELLLDVTQHEHLGDVKTDFCVIYPWALSEMERICLRNIFINLSIKPINHFSSDVTSDFFRF